MRNLEPMANAYNPRSVEAGWYAWWEKSGFFKPQLTKDGKPLPKGTYVIPIPPPNVTGSLHLGHGLTNAIQDALIRWHRMRGFTTLYLPGCDHAGIATQAVVEKMIWKTEKKTRHDLGREKFIERVWEWKEEYGDKIYSQLRMIGSSYDWTRACFTMDPKFVEAVTEAFVRLHEEKIIYRDTRLVNWSCKLNTALSNLEVENKELEGKTMMPVPGHDPNKKYEFGTIVSFAYPIENSEERIVVATTRLETMLGDTAVAVHPKDPRYQHLIGKYVIHPINNRRIPIIADDELVDMSFGTGAVKITPAHDPNDYRVGKKHQLAFINIFNDNGTINGNGAPFEGLMRFDARIEVLKKLKTMGLYVETKPNKMTLPVCSRSGDIIEPMLKPQWYVDCKDMAKEALDAVRGGKLQIQPKTSEKEWFSWLENIQDWCISRQLWWGHRIPAYFVKIQGQDNEKHDGMYWVSGRTIEEAQAKAYEKFPDIPKDKITLEQDEDVLDTWFSAALWPFASFGWPNTKQQEFELFYPNSLLETGWDILFFWVARMVMMGVKLTGEVPFSQVFCHAMVRDAHGRKMSKSLGNVIDPIDVIRGTTLEALHATLERGNLDPKEIQKAKEGQRKDFPKGIPECGADALRFALCAYQGTNRDINLDVKRVEGYRKFCNKLWNATRFALMKLGDNYSPLDKHRSETKSLSLAERWILHRLSIAVSDVNQGFKDFNFMNVTSAIHKFWLYELCDVYIELVKPVIDGNEASEEVKQSYRETLYTCLDHGLKLMHPFMPYLTEELFQRLPRRASETVPSIMISEFPEDRQCWKSEEVEREFDSVNSIVKAARSLMADYGIKSGASVFVHPKSLEMKTMIDSHFQIISALLFCKDMSLKVANDSTSVPHGCALFVVNNECSVHLLVKGCVDIDVEISKLQDKLAKCLQSKERQDKRRNMDGYEKKVKEEIRVAETEKYEQTLSEIEAIQNSIKNFEILK